jgi:protein-L-isoaspartate(D-aspartate) O-methyltransferase
MTAALGLLAMLTVFIASDLRTRGSAVDSNASLPAAAAQPAPQPAPATPTPVTPTPVTPTPAPQPASQPAPAAPAPAPAAEKPHPPPLPVVSEKGFDIAARTADPPANAKTAYVSWMLAHTDQKEKYISQKWDLAQKILQSKTITHPRILEAFLRTPREFFCRDTRRAYDDAVLPIGYGSTISGPFMVARMTDYLNPQPEHKVLEIGTGSGYQSAFLSELSNHVYTIEIIEPLARETDAIYRKHEARYPEYANIHRKIDDGYYGWPENAPFDRIIVTCGIDHVPPELLRELAPEGIMVIPVGPPSGQTILRIVKHVGMDGAVSLEREDIFHGKRREIFVPFTSKEGSAHNADDVRRLQ